MPLGSNPRKTAYLELVVAKVAKKSIPFKGGRLSSTPIYYLLLFQAPRSVVAAMEKLM